MGKKDKNKLYDFGDVMPNKGVAAFPGHRIYTSPTILNRLPGFFIPISRGSLMPDSFWTVKLGRQEQTGNMSHRTINQPFNCILRFLWLKIWMNMYLYWKQYRIGLATTFKNGWCGSHASGNCVPDKNESKTKL